MAQPAPAAPPNNLGLSPGVDQGLCVNGLLVCALDGFMCDLPDSDAHRPPALAEGTRLIDDGDTITLGLAPRLLARLSESAERPGRAGRDTGDPGTRSLEPVPHSRPVTVPAAKTTLILKLPG
jgi:hypothetical protein